MPYRRRHIREEDFVLITRGVQIAEDVFQRGPKSWFAINDDYVGWPSCSLDNYILTYAKNLCQNCFDEG